jgi:hypothetical protein
VQDGEGTNITAGHALAAKRLQLRWRCNVRAARVSRRRRAMQSRPATCCPNVRALLDKRERFAEEISKELECSVAATPVLGAREQGMKLRFDWQERKPSADRGFLAVLAVQHASAQPSESRRFSWLPLSLSQRPELNDIQP